MSNTLIWLVKSHWLSLNASTFVSKFWINGSKNLTKLLTIKFSFVSNDKNQVQTYTNDDGDDIAKNRELLW